MWYVWQLFSLLFVDDAIMSLSGKDSDDLVRTMNGNMEVVDWLQYDSLYRYEDSYYKDKTVVRLPYFHSGKAYTAILYIETAPRLFLNLNKMHLLLFISRENSQYIYIYIYIYNWIGIAAWSIYSQNLKVLKVYKRCWQKLSKFFW